MALIICGAALPSQTRAAEVATVSPKNHEAVRASVIDPTPANYTIDVETLANLGVDDNAPTFAVYIKRRVPETCGDFRKLELPYTKPKKYLRQFDLTKHEEVIQALDQYGCVVMRNIPSKS
jgi:hypothetical protein